MTGVEHHQVRARAPQRVRASSDARSGPVPACTTWSRPPGSATKYGSQASSEPGATTCSADSAEGAAGPGSAGLRQVARA